MGYQQRVFTLSLKKSQSTASIFQNKKPIDFTHKQAINRIIRELAADDIPNGKSQNYLKEVLRRGHVQQMFREEFNLQGQGIIDLEAYIISQCEEIIKTAHNKHQVKKTVKPIVRIEQVKSQPLTLLQRKELERSQTLEYFNFPVQPCVQSLYYLSKIAQSQSLRIMIPPTVLLGYGDDNRIMYNDYKTGKLVVESKNISPKRIQQFITQHMVNGPVQSAYTIEDKLLYPKFVIRLASKGSTQNQIKLYYSRESLIADLLSFWGSYDLALQMFVKQKHPMRPCIHRCFVNKNGHVYKAMAISNQDNIGKDHQMYGQILQMIKSTHLKSKGVRITGHNRQPSEPRQKQALTTRPRTGSVLMNMERFLRDNTRRVSLNNNEMILTRNKSINTLEPIATNTDVLDSHGFPTSLDTFKLNDFYNEMQQSFPTDDLKRAFICTSDNMDNLTMMNCRPSALPQANQMTQDLYRLFSQYYLKIQKFGNLCQFVCDFMEDHNGLMYLLQVKSFECEGVLHEWQMPFQPVQAAQTVKILSEEEEQALQMVNQEKTCQAGIICGQKHQQLKEWFVQALKDKDLWEGNQSQRSEKLIRKYHAEIEVGKEACFCLQSEKQRISPLFPLTTFCDMAHNKQVTDIMLEKRRDSLRRSSTFQQQQGDDQMILTNSYMDESHQQQDCMVPVCPTCGKVLELFQARYYALVFKTEQTQEELRRLKLRLANHWTADNLQFIVSIYKQAKKSLYIVGDIDRIEKRAIEQAVRERAKSPDSVMRKTIKNARPRSGLKNHTESTKGQTFEQFISIDDNKPSTAQTARRPSSQIKASRSLLRSIDRFNRNLETIGGGSQYDLSKMRPMSSSTTMFKRSDTAFQSSQMGGEVGEYGESKPKKKAGFLNMIAANHKSRAAVTGSAFSSRNHHATGSTNNLINSGGKSDKEMLEYFNNKRLLSRLIEKRSPSKTRHVKKQTIVLESQDLDNLQAYI